MFENEILSAIDNVNEAIDDSSFHVLESMVSLYSKEIDFMDFCSDDYKTNIVMEGEVMDEVKQKGKKDSNKLITFLLFIPRVIMATCKALAKAFNNSSLGKKIKKIGDDMNKAATASEKKARVEEFNKAAEGSMKAYYDEKSGKIKFKKGVGDLLGTVAWIADSGDTIYTLFSNIKDEFDVANPSNIRNFVDECDRIIRGRSTASKAELYDMGFDALGDAIDHISKSTKLIENVGEAAASKVSKKIAELKLNDENPEDHKLLMSAKELSNKIATICGGLTAVTSVLKVFDRYSKYGSRIMHYYQDRSDSAQAALDDVKDEIFETSPELRQQYPQNEGETEEAYKKRIADAFFINLVRQQFPDADDEQVNNAASTAFCNTVKALEKQNKEITAQALQQEYEERVRAYHEEKDRLHRENPTRLERFINSRRNRNNNNDSHANNAFYISPEEMERRIKSPEPDII